MEQSALYFVGCNSFKSLKKAGEADTPPKKHGHFDAECLDLSGESVCDRESASDLGACTNYYKLAPSSPDHSLP
eukprot:1161525-Pelagomonas_calceolata.AAC.9